MSHMSSEKKSFLLFITAVFSLIFHNSLLVKNIYCLVVVMFEQVQDVDTLFQNSSFSDIFLISDKLSTIICSLT